MNQVDARGELCPLPVVKAKKAMEEMNHTGVLKILVDNEVAVENVKKLGKSKGAKVEVTKLSDHDFEVVFHMGEGEALETPKEAACELMVDHEEANLVVVFSSDRMGEGNDELGKLLAKGYIFAMTQQERLPNTILFYNGGATLTTEGSPALEDLKKMQEQGVRILTCGTCLDYYGLKDKLMVGEVTNLYELCEVMEHADKLVKP